MLLEGRTALVTGAGRGIGAAIARAFADHGARLVLAGRSEAAAQVAATLRERGGDAIALTGDLTDEVFVRQLVQTCRQRFTHLDVLVNNAGLLRPGVLGMTPLAAVREMLEINVVAMIGLTQLAIRIMDGARAPSVVNLASIAGTDGLEGLSAYSASKGAVVAFTRAAAKELAARGIRVNAIAPGVVETELLRELASDPVQRTAAIRMGRAGTPEEIAAAAVYLVGPESRYVTGQVLGIDGGMRA